MKNDKVVKATKTKTVKTKTTKPKKKKPQVKQHRTIKKKTKRKSIRKSVKKTVQKGGAPYHGRKVTLHDKMAEGIGMFLSGPAPTFTTAFMKLGNQAVKGFKDNFGYLVED